MPRDSRSVPALLRRRVVRPCLQALSALAQSRSPLGLLRFGLRRSRVGSLRPGERAPDVALLSLKGAPEQLLDHHRGRPLVLVFGSFT
jgi:hypothetical protein